MSSDRTSILRESARAPSTPGRSPPELLAPRSVAALWILIGALVCAGAAAWNVDLPISTRGFGAVVEWREDAPPAPGSLVLVAFVPAASGARLAPAQPFVVHRADGDRRATALRVESRASSPAELERRFDLGAAARARLVEPACVAILPFEPGGPLAPQTWRGSVLEVETALGARSALTLLPYVGRLFDDAPSGSPR